MNFAIRLGIHSQSVIGFAPHYHKQGVFILGGKEEKKSDLFLIKSKRDH
jgi:hypothetical protein